MKKDSKVSPSSTKSTSKNEVYTVHISKALPLDWNEWAAESSDWKIIPIQSAEIKSLPTHEIAKINPHQYDRILMGSSQSKKWVSELISGYGTDEWASPFLAFNQKAAKEIANYHPKPNSAYEWLYVSEKVGAKSFTLWGDIKTQPLSFKHLLVSKIKASSEYYFNNAAQKIHRWIFMALSLLTLFTFGILSRSAGISGDEITQYEYSRVAANYYLSWFGSDKPIDTLALKGQKMATLAANAQKLGPDLATIEDPERLMHLYGSSFDTFTTILAGIIGVKDIYDFRHFMNALFGFIIIFFGALIIKKITGSWKYAWIGLLALFFTPRLMGEALNNPKDIPFAAGYVIALYYMIKLFGSGNRFKKSYFLGLIAGIALAISIRVGGIILIPMVLLYAGISYIQEIGIKMFLSLKWKGILPWIGTTLSVLVLGYFFGILPWPWGLSDPLGNPAKALKAFSNYSGSLRQLFEGVMYDSDLLPRHYLIKYILITTPIVSLIGASIFIVNKISKLKQISLNEFMVFFAAVFPVFYIWLQKSNVYGGLRHALFVIPCIVSVGIIGFYLLEKLLEKSNLFKWIIPGASLSLVSLPAIFVVQSHPLQYVYFNETVGGVNGAYGKYEMDYYLASLRPSTEWFLNEVARKNPKDTFVVLTYGMDQVKYYCRNDKNVKVGFTRYDERGDKKWNYAIFYNSYMDKYRLLEQLYPPKGTVFSPMVSGKPMGIVVKRQNLLDFNGYQSLRKGKIDSAIGYFKQYLTSDPNQNEIWLALSDAYQAKGKKDSAVISAEKAIKLYPDYTTAMFRLLDIYYKEQSWSKVIEVCNRVLEIRPKEEQALFFRAIGKAQSSDVTGALDDLLESIKISPFNQQFYQLGAQLYNATGNKAEAQRYQKAINDNYTKNEIYMELTGKNLPGVE